MCRTALLDFIGSLLLEQVYSACIAVYSNFVKTAVLEKINKNNINIINIYWVWFAVLGSFSTSCLPMKQYFSGDDLMDRMKVEI